MTIFENSSTAYTQLLQSGIEFENWVELPEDAALQTMDIPEHTKSVPAEKLSILWGKLSLDFEENIHLTSDWQPGEPVNFQGDSLQQIENALENVQLKLDIDILNDDRLATAMVQFAAEQGFLNNGELEEFEASEIISFLDTDDFTLAYNKAPLAKSGSSAEIISAMKKDDFTGIKTLDDIPELIPDIDDIPEPKPALTENQQLYYDNKWSFQFIAVNFAQWAHEKGGDDLISIKDAKEIRKRYKKGTPEYKAVDLLVNLLESDKESGGKTIGLDTAAKGGKADGKVSAKDLGVWMEKNEIFSGQFTKDNAQDIHNMYSHWQELSRGDGKVSAEDIHIVAENPTDKSGKPIYSQGAVDAANFLLYNPDYFYFLDMHGSAHGGDFDGNVSGEDVAHHSDGLISPLSRQSSEGNCWVLTGLNSLANTPKGAQAIRESIRYDQATGDYYVTFRGDPDQKEYKVTEEQIKKSKYTKDNSDRDMLIFNIAVEQFSKDHPELLGFAADDNDRGIGDGGYTETMYRLVMGQDVEVRELSHGDGIINWFEQNADDINDGKYAVNISAGTDGDKIGVRGEDGGHAFSVVGVDAEKEIIYYINPWNASEVLEISFDDYKKIVDDKADTGRIILAVLEPEIVIPTPDIEGANGVISKLDT